MTETRGKVVVAMSGGVDSSVAACLLREQGYDVIGLFMRTGVHSLPPGSPSKPLPPSIANRRNRHSASPPSSEDSCTPGPDRHRGCCSAEDASDARAVAGKLGIPFFALNFEEQFDELIEAFASEYSQGRTPNPCILCNQRLKFGRLAEYARAAGADYIATGHYARVELVNGRPRLRCAVDTAKDQTYVLFGIAPETLRRTLFPIGGLTKERVRDYARQLGLAVSDKPDSVDICFAPDRDYARIVRERRPEAFREGAILDAAGREVGRHSGLPNYTIGQRRGLGVAVGLPIYVSAIDPASNTVRVGPREALSKETFIAGGVHWLVDPPLEPLRAAVKIRYTHPASPATVEPLGPDRVRVRFDEPQFAITPGQGAVIYDRDYVLGGGWIE